MSHSQSIFESIQPIIKDSRFVLIDDSAIDKFVESVTEEEMEKSEFDTAPLIPNPTEERYVGFTIVYNAINFCYWGEPKWTIEIEGKKYDGSYGLTRAFVRALQNGHDLLNPECLADLSRENLAEILKGNTVIPLFEERLQLLRELGKILNQKFQGKWINIIKKGNYDAVGIITVLTGDFASIYNDEVIFEGKRVKFYKRAQLVPAYIVHDLSLTGAISLKLTGIEKLTAFADYKVPQILRKLGILKYSPKLAQKVDSMTLIDLGSREEVEIRANTIEAIERATKKAKKRFPGATAARIDGVIWFRGQKKSPDDKPYHRTKTIWY